MHVRTPDTGSGAPVALVLFDLDGTLADTLPDLCGALNEVLSAHGCSPVSESVLRPVVSRGSLEIIRAGLAATPGAAEKSPDSLRDAFLRCYAARKDARTVLFEQMPRLLEHLDSSGTAWGVVTNKLSRFTEPLLHRLGLLERARCIVSGDTAPHAKPHPAPLVHACRVTGIEPARSIYIGDAPGDVLAAHRAGMRAVVAQWGYLPPEPAVRSWGGDFLAESPAALARLIETLQIPANASSGRTTTPDDPRPPRT